MSSVLTTLSTTSNNRRDALPTTTDEGKLILRGRVKSPADAQGRYNAMYQDDLQASQNRASVQQLIDGLPPLNPNQLLVSGSRNTCNVNWLDAQMMLQEAVGPLNDLLTELSDGLCTMPTNYGEPEQRQPWSEIMAEEATRTIFAWPEFVVTWLQNALQTRAHGVSFCYREDEFDWRWKSTSLQYMKVPRKVGLSTAQIEYCGCRDDILPHKLWAKIKDEESAKHAGWNPKAVREAIKMAVTAAPDPLDPEAWVALYKDNDLTLGTGNEICRCIHFWIKELDGTVSQYLLRADGVGDFLYKKEGRHASMDRFIHLYLDNVGTNTDLHSVRGLGQNIFAMASWKNRIVCKFSDQLAFDATPLWKSPEGEAGMRNTAVQTIGGMNVISQNWELEDKHTQDYSKSVLPGLALVDSLLQRAGSRYNSATPLISGDGRETAKGEEIRMQQLGQLSDTAMNLYYLGWEPTIRETIRRLCRKDYLPTDPGGTEAAEFRRRCFERGVPLEAIYEVDFDNVRAIRAIGGGSAASRAVALGRVQPVVGAADPVGQRYYYRAVVKMAAGTQWADMMFPEDMEPRVPIDAQIAELENNQLAAGMEVLVFNGQNDLVHAQVHIQRLGALNEKFVNGEMDLVAVTMAMQPIHAHAAIHMQRLESNPNPLVPVLRQQMQQWGAIIEDGIKHIQKLQRDQQKQQMQEEGVPHGTNGDTNGEQQQAEDAGNTLNLMRETATANAKVQMDRKKGLIQLGIDQAKADQTLMNKQREFDQKMAHRDAEQAADLLTRQPAA